MPLSLKNTLKNFYAQINNHAGGFVIYQNSMSIFLEIENLLKT